MVHSLTAKGSLVKPLSIRRTIDTATATFMYCADASGRAWQGQVAHPIVLIELPMLNLYDVELANRSRQAAGFSWNSIARSTRVQRSRCFGSANRFGNMQ